MPPIVALTLLLLLAACAPQGVLTARGPVLDKAGGQFALFNQAWNQAQSDPAADPRLLRAGFSLVYDNCADFFRNRGRLQEDLALVQNTTGSVLPLATGALGLAGGAGNAIAVLSLAGSGIDSGIGVAASNFLFGAENIDDVRILTLNAIAAHQNAVYGLAAANPAGAGFDWVVNQIMDDQTMCEAPHILALTKDAIAKGNVIAYQTATGSANTGTPLPTRVGVRIRN